MQYLYGDAITITTCPTLASVSQPSHATAALGILPAKCVHQEKSYQYPHRALIAAVQTRWCSAASVARLRDPPLFRGKTQRTNFTLGEDNVRAGLYPAPCPWPHQPTHQPTPHRGEEGAAVDFSGATRVSVGAVDEPSRVSQSPEKAPTRVLYRLYA